MGTQGRRFTVAGVVALALLPGFVLPAPVQAQDCGDREEQAVFGMVQGFLGELVDFIGDMNASPTESDCEKVCRGQAKACKQWAGILIRSTVFAGTSFGKMVRPVCKTATDPSVCAAMVKNAKLGAKGFVRAAKADFGQICEDDALATACSLTCNTGASPPATCQDLFPPGP
jgi:hypothetical protein